MLFSKESCHAEDNNTCHHTEKRPKNSTKKVLNQDNVKN